MIRRMVADGWAWDPEEREFTKDGHLPCNMVAARERYEGIDRSDELGR